MQSITNGGFSKSENVDTMPIAGEKPPFPKHIEGGVT
jgi:hypothetical protein